MTTTDSRLHKPGVIGSSPIAAICRTPAAEYHLFEEPSCSDLKLLGRNPRQYYHRKVVRDAPQVNSSALAYGTLLHEWGETVCLHDDDAFWQRVHKAPDQCCTATGALSSRTSGEWIESLPEGHLGVSKADHEKLWAQTRRLLDNPQVIDLISKCIDAEFNIRTSWKHHAIRCRVDAVTPDFGFDWKTTSDEAPLYTFDASCAKFGYHMQSAFYSHCLHSAGWPLAPLRFVVTSTVWPYENFVCHLPDEFIRIGHRKCVRLLDELESRKEWDFWDRYEAQGDIVLPVRGYLLKGE